MARSVLQSAPLDPPVEAELHQRYDVARRSEIGDRAVWFAAHGSEARVVLTSDHADLDIANHGRVALAQPDRNRGVGYDRFGSAELRNVALAVHIGNAMHQAREAVARLLSRT